LLFFTIWYFGGMRENKRINVKKSIFYERHGRFVILLFFTKWYYGGRMRIIEVKYRKEHFFTSGLGGSRLLTTLVNIFKKSRNFVNQKLFSLSGV